MAFDTSMYEWRKYKEYYSENNGTVSFREDTPEHVLASYAKYAAQQEAMHDFATRNDLKKKKGSLFSRPKAAVREQNGAERLFRALENNEPLDAKWFAQSVVHIDEAGKAKVGFSQIDFTGAVYEECIAGEQKCVFIGSKADRLCVSVVLTDHKNRIVQIQDYISEAQ